MLVFNGNLLKISVFRRSLKKKEENPRMHANNQPSSIRVIRRFYFGLTLSLEPVQKLMRGNLTASLGAFFCAKASPNTQFGCVLSLQTALQILAILPTPRF
jgi:hypothetical protein